MEGIQYLISEQGEKTAVLIDLKKYQEEWEDFYDILIAKSRVNEPRINLDDVKNMLKEQGRLNESL